MKKTIQSINLANVNTGTWVRLVMLLMGIAVYVASLFDIALPVIPEGKVTDIVLLIFGLIAFLQSYWKNNSFTESAQEMDKLMQEKKEEVE